MGYVARYVFTRLPKIIEICRGIFNAQDENEWPLKIGKNIPKKREILRIRGKFSWNFVERVEMLC